MLFCMGVDITPTNKPIVFQWGKYLCNKYMCRFVWNWNEVMQFTNTFTLKIVVRGSKNNNHAVLWQQTGRKSEDDGEFCTMCSKFSVISGSSRGGTGERADSKRCHSPEGSRGSTWAVQSSYRWLDVPSHVWHQGQRNNASTSGNPFNQYSCCFYVSLCKRKYPLLVLMVLPFLWFAVLNYTSMYVQVLSPLYRICWIHTNWLPKQALAQLLDAFLLWLRRLLILLLGKHALHLRPVYVTTAQ